MENTKKVAKNAFFLSLANFVPRFFSLIFVMYLARKLGDTGMGEYSLATSIVLLVTIFADFGLGTYVTREVARFKYEAPKYFINIALIKLVTAAAGYLALIGLVKLLDYEFSLQRSIFVFGLYAIVYSYVNFLVSIFQGFEMMEYQALLTGLGIGLQTLLGITVLTLGGGVFEIGGTAFLTWVLILLLGFVFLQKFFKTSLALVQVSFIRKILREALPFVATAFFITLYFKIDVVLLSKLVSKEELGWYSASFKLIEALQFIPGVITGAAFPLMSRLFLNGKQQLKKSYQMLFKYLLFLALPMSMGVTILARPLIILIYGEEFLLAATSLKILIWALGFIFLNSLLASTMAVINRMKTFSIVIGFNVLLNVALNLILIPSWGANLGYLGASLATLISEVFNFLIFITIISKHLASIDLSLFLKSLFCSFLMVAGLILTQNISLFFNVPLAISIYFLSLYFVKGLDEQDTKLLKAIWQRK